MIFTVLALLLGAAIGYFTGGRLRHVAGHPLRGWWLLAAGVVLQAAAGHLDLGPISPVGLVASYACLLAFAAENRALVGMGVVVIGLSANALVITANGGMPVRSRAVVAAHITEPVGLAGVQYGRLHHAEASGDVLRGLDDRIPLPATHQVLSFGDLIIAVGVADVVARLYHPRRRRRRRLTPQTAPILQAVSLGSGLDAGRDLQPAGQPFDVLAQIPAMSAQRHHMAQLAVAGPTADRLG